MSLSELGLCRWASTRVSCWAAWSATSSLSSSTASQRRARSRVRVTSQLQVHTLTVLWIRIGFSDPDLDPASGGQKWPSKIEKKYRIFIFWSAGCSLLRAEGFFCSLVVLYGGLGISKLQFLIKKFKIKVFRCKFFSILGHQTWIRNPDLQLVKMLNPDPYPDPH